MSQVDEIPVGWVGKSTWCSQRTRHMRHNVLRKAWAKCQRFEKRSRQDVAFTILPRSILSRRMYANTLFSIYKYYSADRSHAPHIPLICIFVLLQSHRKRQKCARDCKGNFYFGTQNRDEVGPSGDAAVLHRVFLLVFVAGDGLPGVIGTPSNNLFNLITGEPDSASLYICYLLLWTTRSGCSDAPAWSVIRRSASGNLLAGSRMYLYITCSCLCLPEPHDF